MKKSRRIAIIILFSMSTLILIVSISLIYAITKDAKADNTLLPTPSSVTFYDINDRIINQDEYVRIEEISENVINAFISVEDKRFYQHNGIDVKRIVGAVIEDVKAGSFRQGGSTITCQLVKNTHLTNEKSIERKLKEAKIAIELEKQYTKDEILEMYLNVLYFGKGIYGIKNACTAYLNKSTDEINPREAATLAAIIANPSRYSPIEKWDANQERAEMILGLMKQEGYLSEEEYDRAIDLDIVLNYGDFYNNYSRIYLNSTLSELKSLGFTTQKNHKINIHTYHDPKAQAAAEAAIDRYKTGLPTPSSNEIIIADNTLSGIVAYASNFDNKPLKRQPGSLLKPFIYATAIQDGTLIPASPIHDAPTSFGNYKPTNYNDTNYGWIDAKYALSHSLNIPAVSILNEIGIEKATNTLIRAGISLSEKDKNLALALGGTTYGSTTTEICEGYTSLANNGAHNTLSFIRKITDKSGKSLFRREYEKERILSAEAAYLTTTMLMECKNSGTAKQLSQLPYEIAAKTGTVAAGSGNSDAWCAAYTTQHTLVCRFSSRSKDNPLPNTLTGGNLPTKVVRSTLKSLYSDHTPSPFFKPMNVRSIEIDSIIKTEMHKLVPRSEHSIGATEAVLAPRTYRFDAIDPDALFFADLSTTQGKNGTYIRYKKLKNVEYSAYLNGKECPYTESGFYLEPQFFPLAKLELICKNAGKTVYRKTKIVRVGQSLITSVDSIAASINAS